MGRFWKWLRAAAEILGVLNATGVVKVKETDAIVDAVDKIDDIVNPPAPAPTPEQKRAAVIVGTMREQRRERPDYAPRTRQ